MISFLSTRSHKYDEYIFIKGKQSWIIECQLYIISSQDITIFGYLSILSFKIKLEIEAIITNLLLFNL